MIAKFIKYTFYLSLIVLVLAIAIGYYQQYEKERELEVIREWAESNKINVNSLKLEEFKIEFDENEWNQLVSKLNNTRYFDRLDEKYVKRFEFGFDPEYARELVEYWRTKFDWKKRVGHLNRFAQYKMRIDDEVTVHYLRKVTNKDAARPVIPLMLLDGWPGSFYGFYRMIDYLEEHFRDLSFDIVVASIPGYGYSTPLHKPVDTVDTAQYFDAIMRHIHGENVKYFVHGEDWGSGVATNLARLYPQRVQGIHITMPFSFGFNMITILKNFGCLIFPKYFLTPEEIKANIFEKSSFFNLIKVFLKDFGYMHLQATKPDTLGLGLTDSPVGLMGYVLEKYSSWTFEFSNEIVGKKDGNLNRFDRDDLLTIITIYWMTNSITSSIRYYKNSVGRHLEWPKPLIGSSIIANVPVGINYFKNEILFSAFYQIKSQYQNLTHFNIQSTGGHFGAFENPKISANDLVTFIKSL